MSGLTDSLDARLLQDYEKDLELIESQKKSMEAQVAAYRTARASDPFYTNDALRHDIADNLYKLYILLACAVRLKMQPHDDFELALRPFGFKLNHATRAQDMLFLSRADTYDRDEVATSSAFVEPLAGDGPLREHTELQHNPALGNATPKPKEEGKQ